MRAVEELSFTEDKEEAVDSSESDLEEHRDSGSEDEVRRYLDHQAVLSIDYPSLTFSLIQSWRLHFHCKLCVQKTFLQFKQHVLMLIAQSLNSWRT